MPPKFGKEEIDQIVQRAVTAANEALAKQLTADLTKEIDQRCDEISKELKAENAALKEKVSKLEEQVSEQSGQLKMLESKLDNCIKWANKNEQYSRRNSLKISGLKCEDNANTRLSACKLLREKLGIQIKEGDIDAAHPLPRSRQGDDSDERPPTIQVKFSRRDKRDDAIRRRKQLKGSGVAILEDLTKMNVKLMNRLKENDLIKHNWSMNGKIYGLTTTGKKIQFDLFDNIETKIANVG
jgi:gas vesicle protein